MSDAEVWPGRGAVVVPEAPRYHWYEGEDEDVTTVMVQDCPSVIVCAGGCVVMTGAAQTVTVAAPEEAAVPPQSLAALAQ